MSSKGDVPSIFNDVKEDLSIEETNKIRVSLGLRPIPISRDEQQPKNTDNDDWLSSIKIKASPEKEQISSGKPRSGAPEVTLGTNVQDIAYGKDVVLTLKDQHILQDEEGDDDEYVNILEQEKIEQDKIDAKNIQLRQMNRERKRNKAVLNVSSLDIDNTENGDIPEDAKSKIYIGATTSMLIPDDTEPFDQLNLKDKVKVILHSKQQNHDEENDTDTSKDFLPVKIKKRKRMNNDTKIKTRVKFVNKLKHVDLIDEDNILEDEENEELLSNVSVLPNRRQIPTIKTSEQIAQEIAREKLEREERLRYSKTTNTNSNGSDYNLVIGGNVSFLDSLKNNIIEKMNSESIPHEEDKSDTTTPKSLHSSTIQENSIHSEPSKAESSSSDIIREPNFYDGIASTLTFLNDYNKLTKNNNAEEIVQTKRKTTDSSAQLKSNCYDPDVKLVYKDEDGNELTTKEAYKQLSQKFHGTKSNKAKIEKNKAKIEARNNRKNKSNIFGFEA